MEKYLEQQSEAPKPLHFESEVVLNQAADAIALSHGYRVDFVVSDRLGTFATSFNKDTGGATVLISPDLMKRSDSSEHISSEEVFSVGIAHELGHVKIRKQEINQTGHIFKSEDKKTAYFYNIVDDVVINQDLIAKAGYFRKRMPTLYDEILFKKEDRTNIKNDPRHTQLMTSMLLLSMLDPAASTDNYSKEMLDKSLDNIGIQVSPEVYEALSGIISYEHGGKQFNLLRLLKTHGMDYEQRTMVSGIIHEQYDKLYEEDLKDNQGQDDVDYSKAGACGHDHDETPSESGDESSEEQDPSDGKNSEGEDSSNENESEGSSDGQEDNSDEEGSEPDNQPGKSEDEASSEGDEGEDGKTASIKNEAASAIAKEIAENNQNAQDEKSRAEQEAKEKEEQAQKEALKKELGLEENDFNEYLKARQRYEAEINDFADIITRLKRERNDDLLSPSNNLNTIGHRINVKSLVGAIASGSLNDNPEIFKSPEIGEKVQYEFDGLDLFLLCDVSQSMSWNGGHKAREAAASAMIILEGLMRSADLASAEDLVRVQIQAFGNGNHTLSPLSHRPDPRALGDTYAKLLNPNEGTQVSTSLIKTLDHIKPAVSGEKPRLQVVGIISDGEFNDKESAKVAGQDVENNGGLILQFIYDGANVTVLSNDAKRIDVDNAKDLPKKLFELLPELLEYMRSKNVQ